MYEAEVSNNKLEWRSVLNCSMYVYFSCVNSGLADHMGLCIYKLQKKSTAVQLLFQYSYHTA